MPGKIVAITAAVLALTEVIVAAVVNFHTFGFILGLLCLLASAGFLYYQISFHQIGPVLIQIYFYLLGLEMVMELKMVREVKCMICLIQFLLH